MRIRRPLFWRILLSGKITLTCLCYQKTTSVIVGSFWIKVEIHVNANSHLTFWTGSRYLSKLISRRISEPLFWVTACGNLIRIDLVLAFFALDHFLERSVPSHFLEGFASSLQSNIAAHFRASFLGNSMGKSDRNLPHFLEGFASSLQAYRSTFPSIFFG